MKEEMEIKLSENMLKFTLERKNVKHINLRIKSDGSIFVSANLELSIEAIENFIRKKEHLILNHLEKVEDDKNIYKESDKRYIPGETFIFLGRAVRLKVIKSLEEYIKTDGVYIYLYIKNPDNFNKKKNMMESYYADFSKKIFGEILENIYPKFKKYGVNLPQIKIRKMTKRWGSCLYKKEAIILNKKLIEIDRECIEYVVLHELSHFIHPNHSKDFYNLVTVFMPDWKKRKARLEERGKYLKL